LEPKPHLFFPFPEPVYSICIFEPEPVLKAKHFNKMVLLNNGVFAKSCFSKMVLLQNDAFAQWCCFILAVTFGQVRGARARIISPYLN
jgi:hypothetical protein